MLPCAAACRLKAHDAPCASGCPFKIPMLAQHCLTCVQKAWQCGPNELSSMHVACKAALEPRQPASLRLSCACGQLIATAHLGINMPVA